MKILKRIIYTLFGLLIAGTVSLVGIILYAEYSGNHFTPDSVPGLAQLNFSSDESRLTYDENDNLIELPKTQTPEDTADNSGASETASGENAADSSATMPATGETTADSNTAAASATAATPAATPTYSPSNTGGEPELPYVMDLSSALFHTPDCPYAANIATDNRSEMTTTSAKIMNAGYEPCSNCHPDTAAAAASGTP